MSLCLIDILTLLHPYAPHITERLYGLMTEGEILTTSEWPLTLAMREESEEASMTRIFDIVRTIRNIRAES